MNNFIINIWQNVYYGLLSNRPSIDFSKIPNNFNLISHYDETRDIHWVEAPDLPEFFASGKTPEDLAKNIGDTILVYFDVPTYFSKKYEDGIFTFHNKKTGERELITVNKKELDRVLA